VPSIAAISSRSCGKNAGLTQVQVAAMMGVTQARVSQIEHGKIAG
jgi:transcriptional regulator with XRE-family HTH domain